MKFRQQDLLELGETIISNFKDRDYQTELYYSMLTNLRIKLHQSWREWEPLTFVSMVSMTDNIEKIIDSMRKLKTEMDEGRIV